MAEKNPKRSWVVTILSVIMIGAIAAYGYLLFQLMESSSRCRPVPNYLGRGWWEQFLDQFIRCRSLAELGDFLAGAFAPVAFFMLAVAVLLQSLELKAQREDLALARDDARRRQADKVFDQLLHFARSRLVGAGNPCAFHYEIGPLGEPGDAPARTTRTVYLTPQHVPAEQELLFALANSFRDATKGLPERRADQALVFKGWEYAGHFAALRKTFNDMEKIRENLSEPYAVRISALNYHRAKDGLDKLEAGIRERFPQALDSLET